MPVGSVAFTSGDSVGRDLYPIPASAANAICAVTFMAKGVKDGMDGLVPC